MRLPPNPSCLNGKMSLDRVPSGLGSLPSNTIANPRGDLKVITTLSGVSYDGPTIPPTPSPLPKVVKRKTKATKDKVQTTRSESTTHVQPLVVQDPIPKPDVAPKPNPKPSIPYPSRLDDQKLREKTNSQMLKFLQIFQRLRLGLSFTDALLYIPKFASTFKSLLSNKEKLFKLDNTSLTENYSAVLLKKLPEKLRDPERFLIPCDFQGLESCMSLADLGVSINLMPLSVWKKLSLPDLTSTCMTLELATRSYAYLASIAEDVFVQVGKFTFPDDFIVVDYDVDPRVPLIIGRPFLRTACALVDFADELTLLDPIPPGKEDNNFDFETDLREIEFLLHQDPSPKSNIETINPILEKFTDEPALNYLPPSGDDDDDDDDLFDLKSDNDEWKKLLYGDCYKDINSEKDKNKDSKMKSLVVGDHIFKQMIYFLSYSIMTQLFLRSHPSHMSASLSSSSFRNEDKVFNPGILILGGTHILNDESKDKDLIIEDCNFLSISSDKELLIF
uniref:Reverse transcriptase domain-containing protein n=1 Tax=Tanacetum cinerariifolium TaxID=118510 RepID=A0A6L2MNQ5_TANCI|nr:reverse transcriptase domain-containing protein [Tanacetum cinerariifolium]